MSLKEHQIDVMEMLARNEEAVGRLYQAYAQKFPDYEEFWAKLATDELAHAQWIRRLLSGVEEEDVYFKKGRFRKKTIQSFLNYLEERLASLQTQEMSLINALSIAVDVEKALIESRIFQVFKADPKILKGVLKNLDAATREHRDRLRKAWEEKRHSL